MRNGLPQCIDCLRARKRGAPSNNNAALRDRVSLIEAEALRRAAGVADQVHAEQKTANLSYVDGWLDAADIIFQRIEALIPAKGADRDAD